MIGRTNVSSGGAPAIAWIITIFPSGSTCTCTNGSTTITSKYTNAFNIFEIPSVGSWTVSCTDGTDTASEAVTVASGGIYTVKLTYWDGTIYEVGNEYTDYTGGWTLAKSGTNSVATIDDTTGITLRGYLANDGSYTGRAKAETTNAVDLTDFSTLYVTSTESVANRTAEVRLYVAASPITTSSGDTVTAYQYMTTATSSHISSLDISSLSGEYYVGVWARRQNGGGIYTYITNIQLS